MNLFPHSIVGLVAVTAALHAAPLPGPGISPLTFNDTETFTPLANFRSPPGTSFGNGAMYRGYFAVGIDVEEDSAGFQFWDISNPRLPRLAAQKYDAESRRLREIQNFSFARIEGRDLVAFPSHAGLEIWDFTDFPDIRRHSSLAIEEGGGNGIYNGIISTYWQPPYIYCGGMNTGIYVVETRDTRNPRLVKKLPSSALGGRLAGPMYPVGNLLVATSMQAGDTPGAFSTFDISNPENPILLNLYEGRAANYTSFMSGNKIYGHGIDGHVRVYDIADPTRIALVDSVGIFGRGGYGIFQDGFMHCGMSEQYVKIDVSGARPKETGRLRLPDADNDWVIPLGNLIFIGDDDGTPEGSPALLTAHQTQPDTQGPEVNMIYPKPGAVSQATTSRVGINFTDNIDFSSVDSASFIVRKVGGAAVKGWYGTMMSLVNFSPEIPLEPEVEYEIFLPAGGVKDWAGNPTEKDFVSRFSTGGALSLKDKPGQGRSLRLPTTRGFLDAATLRNVQGRIVREAKTDSR